MLFWDVWNCWFEFVEIKIDDLWQRGGEKWASKGRLDSEHRRAGQRQSLVGQNQCVATGNLSLPLLHSDIPIAHTFTQLSTPPLYPACLFPYGHPSIYSPTPTTLTNTSNHLPYFPFSFHYHAFLFLSRSILPFSSIVNICSFPPTHL